MKKEEIIESIRKIEKISNEILQTKEKMQDRELERYFCKLEKARMDMYDEVHQSNLWREFMGDEDIIEYIDNQYKAKIEDDIRKENGYTDIMIFANYVDKIVLHKKGFYFGNNNTILIPYTEYGKYLLRNNNEIRKSIYLRLKELYKVELTDFKFADLKLDENNYIVIMPLINMKKLARLYCYFDCNEKYKNIHIFGLEEYEKIIKTFIPKCNYKSLNREKIEELLNKYADEELDGGENNETIQNK